MEIKERNSNIILVAMSVMESSGKDSTIRTLATISRIIERKIEILIPELISKGFINNTDEIVGPNVSLSLTRDGRSEVESFIGLLEYGSQDSLNNEVAKRKDDDRLRKQELKLNKIEFQKTHEWHSMGGFGPGAGELTKDKWYPMGSICRKCGLRSNMFQANPVICPKYEKDQ